MDWRKWVYDKLDFSELTDIVPLPEIYAAGSLEGSPEARPFLVVRLGTTVPSVGDAAITGLTIYAHDEPGSYDRIGNILGLIKARLRGQVVDLSGIACNWTGFSDDLSDDIYGTITRLATFDLVGRDQ